MNKTKQHHSGYILILSLLILATLTAIATYIVTRGSIYMPFIRTMIDREKAVSIARGGIDIAMAQLAWAHEESEKTNTAQGQNAHNQQPQKPAAARDDYLFLLHFLPIINRWQEYTLTEKNDGIDARIRICLICEEGKININTIYDFTHKKFYGKDQSLGNWDAIMQELCKRIEQIQGGKDLFKALEKFLKQREYKLIDATELLHIKEFDIFKRNQEYTPPDSTSPHLTDKKNIALTDIFTVHSQNKTVNPWVFSNALTILLSLPEAQPNDTSERNKNVQEWLKEFKQPKSWKNDWAVLLMPMYQKDLSTLPKNIESIFDTSANPRIFSVISEGQVGTVTMQLFAILERIKHTYNNKTLYKVNIKKLYWL